MTQLAASVVVKQDVVRHHQGRPSARLQSANDMLDEWQWPLCRVGGDDEVGPRHTFRKLVERWIGEDQVGLTKRLAVRPQRVAICQDGVDPVEHHVHDPQAARRADQLHADVSVAALKECLVRGQREEVVGRLTYVGVGAY